MKNSFLLLAFLSFSFAAFSQPICDFAIPVQCGTVILGDSTSGPSNANNANNYGCLSTLFGSGSGGPERVYKMTVTQSGTYRFVLDVLNGTDLDIIVLRPQQLPCTFNNLACPGGGYSYEYNMSYGVYREVLDIRLDAHAFPYYIFIDGKANPNPGGIVGRFNFSVDCTCSSIEASNDLPTGEQLFCDDFGNYVAGQVLEPQSTRWEQRDSSMVDGVVTAQGYVGNGVRFTGSASATPDEFFLLRDRYNTADPNTGRYRMSWKMRTEIGKKGHFSIAHAAPVGTNGAYNMGSHVNFLDNGVGELRVGSSSSSPIATFPYPQGTWISVVQIVDISANKAELWVNDNFVKSWAFNIGDNGTSTRLAAINFKAQNGYDFKVDELCVWRAVTPCNPPASVPILVENGVVYPSQAAARCALYTSREWGDGLSLCEFGGTFLHRGDRYFGEIDNTDFAPSLLRNDPCVQAAYGNNVPFPLYADIYLFYKDDDQIVDVGFNDNGNPTMRQFVFSCHYVNGSGNCERGQQCLTEIGPGTYLPNTCDSFYYIVVTSGLVNDKYDIAVIPEGLCGSNYEKISLDCSNSPTGFDGDNLFVGSVSDDSNFDATGAGSSYAACYNGTRPYTGGEKIYQFKLENPALLTFALQSDAPMGVALYSFICANQCLSFSETDENNFLSFKQPLPEGTYFLIVDKGVDDALVDFQLNIHCSKKTSFEIFTLFSCDKPGHEVSPLEMGRVPSTCILCLAPSNQAADNHRVIINNQGLFSPFDQILFLFRDSLSGYLTGSPALSSLWNVSAGQPKEFMLPEDYVAPALDPDTLQCSYRDGQELHLFLSQTGNGNHQFRELFPTFAPLGINGATGQDTFLAGSTSVINHLELGNPVTWYANTTTLEAVDDPTTTYPLKFGSSIPWNMTKEPYVSWLTVSDTFSNVSALFDLRLTFEENTSLLPRSTTLRFVSTQRPDVYRLYVLATQLPQCTPPLINVVADNSAFCAGDSIFLRVDVGTDPVTGLSLAPLYNFEWKDPAGVIKFPGIGVPPEQLGLVLNAGTYAYSVKVTNKFCDGLARDTLVFTVTPPPLPPAATSPISSTICTDDPLPVFSVNNPPPGQVVQWYESLTSNTPIHTGAFFTPTQYSSATYYAGTQFANNGCRSTSRVAFSLTVNPLPSFQLSNKECTPNHQFYNFTLQTNGSTVTVNGAPVTGNAGVFQINNVPILNTVTVRVANSNCDTLALVVPPTCVCDVLPPTFIQDYAFCENQPASIAVGISQPNVVVDWYDALQGGTKLNPVPGNPFMPAMPYLTTYFAQAVNTLNNCVSTRTAVQLTKNLLPTLVLSDTVCTAQQDFYSISVATNGVDALANAGNKTFANGVYTFSMVPIAQSVTITTQSSAGCTRSQVVLPPNCNCLSVSPPVSGGDATACFGEPFPQLEVSVGPGQTANWYLGNTLVETGLVFLPQAPGLYLVETYDPLLDCKSSAKTAVSLIELPEILASLSAPTCAYNRQTYGFTVNTAPNTALMVNNTPVPGNSGVYQVDNIPVGINAQVEITELANDCSKILTVVSPTCPCVETINAPGSNSSNSLGVCQGQPKTLSVTLGSNQTARWYNDQNILVGQGSTFDPSTTIAGTFTFQAEAYNPTTDCSGPNRTAISFTVYPAPGIQTVKSCESQSEYQVVVTLLNANTLSASTGTVAPAGAGMFEVSGIPLGQSVILTALETVNGCSATFEVTPPASCDCALLGIIDAPMPGPDQKACVGQSPFPNVTATVSAPNIVVDWYNASGQLLLQGSNSYTPPNNLPAGLYTFYAEARNSQSDCTSNLRTPVNLIVSPNPSLQISSVACSGDYLTYIVQGQTEPANTVTSTAGSVSSLPGGFFTISGLTLGQPAVITASNTNTTCQTVTTAFLGACPCPQVNLPTSNGDKVMCQGDPVAPVLSVSVDNPATETADWYDAPTGGMLLKLGDLTYQPSPPTTTKTYYVQTRLNSPNISCVSTNRVQVRLEVKPRPNVNAGTDQTICGSDTLVLNGSISGGLGGFWVANGGQFLPNNLFPAATAYVPPSGVQTVALVLVSENPAGPCPAVSDSMVLTLLEAPVIAVNSVTCAQDFQSYQVNFSSSTNILNTTPGSALLQPNSTYLVQNIPIGQNLTIFGFNSANSCTRTVQVSSPSPCPCPTVAQPASGGDTNINLCTGDALPTLSVTVPSGTIANWYATQLGTTPFLVGQSSYTPSFPGDYFVEAQDTVNDCRSIRLKFTITIHPRPVVFLGPNAKYCPGASVSLSADPGSGYTYLWSTGQTGQSIAVSQSGLYQVTVSLNNCTAVDSFQVSAHPTLMGSIGLLDTIKCFGQSAGTLIALPSGGTLPVAAYSWSNGATLQTVTGLAAGIYSVTMTDQAGCTHSETYSISQPSAIAYTVQSIGGGSMGMANGFVNGAASGGTPPYTFQWHTPGSLLPGQTAETIDSIPAGTYYVVISDAEGCTVASPNFSVGNSSISEAGLERYVRLFPNPSTGLVTLNIDLPSKMQVGYQVLDVLGKVLFSKSIENERNLSAQLDLTDYPGGLYLVKITVGDNLVVKKLSIFR